MECVEREGIDVLWEEGIDVGVCCGRMWECVVGGCGSVNCKSVNEGMQGTVGGVVCAAQRVILSLRDSST